RVSERLPRREPFARNELIERAAFDMLHRDEVDLAIGADVVDGDDVGMHERGRGPCFAEEPLAVRGLVDLIGADDFERDAAIQARVPGAVDDAHAALADFGFDAIVREHFALGELDRRKTIEGAQHGVFERGAFGFEKLLDFGTEVGVRTAILLEIFGALGIAEFERGAEDLLDPGPALGSHFAALAEISTRSHALAMAHSRLTVRGAMPRASPVSSTVMPPK